MAAKKIKDTIKSDIIQPDKPISFFKSELPMIYHLFHGCQTDAQKEIMLDFYKKYVNQKWKGNLSNCNGCGTSWRDKFIETRNWVAKNSHLFIN